MMKEATWQFMHELLPRKEEPTYKLLWKGHD